MHLASNGLAFDRHTAANVGIIRDWFAAQGIHLLGRFSYFEYMNVDGAVARALEVANHLNAEQRSETELLARALQRIGKS